jgi:hypothetical protein
MVVKALMVMVKYDLLADRCGPGEKSKSGPALLHGAFIGLPPLGCMARHSIQLGPRTIAFYLDSRVRI